ncbi:MAG: 16S rRNA (cytosine(1402)-N(4))-methyltransferase RsmH [Clostridiaceae bacterium]|nr:16S rRNA (cytosine(1402)-N(4))-methyltransferase RsmH [Eubacteriales bacterium]MDD4138913.1 16S rRNA (cytosine(1402)-N(4))-methyltransferase RsmH [Eubacteriales bacterium]MDD4743012.1 16S rRNA (cytosine(1402)-N(4))-methyltransferase RsmH [Eubacteriales bacterium]NLB44230.1 16S rRNA (cytosine(1402)-N(4))-methyltransferase RsmH [Clostridiaceae bacterium]
MSRDCEFGHQSVLAADVLRLLQVRPDGCYVDCTLGGGGHAASILDGLGPDGLLIGIDRDRDALEAAKSRLQGHPSPAQRILVHANFSDLAQIMAGQGRPAAQGILADLGVSSWQLDQAERGFSYHADGPLDMRMDQADTLTAAGIVNTWPAHEISRILADYGEERYAGRISQAIAARRQTRPFTSTADLAALVSRVMPAASKREAQHPARRTFQALRIAVNNELGALEMLLRDAPGLLAENGRLCVITFHSLEDRLVKQAFRLLENPCICPRDFPVCTCGRRSAGQVVTRRPVTADSEEQKNNPRARSARLRCFEAHAPTV